MKTINLLQERSVRYTLSDPSFLSNLSWLIVTVAAFSIAVLFYSVAEAKGPGTTTGQLLKLPIGARAVAMGEAYTGLSNDSSALSWNPAGIAFLEQKEASFMHSSLIEGINYEHASIIIPGESYAFGGSLSYLGYGDIEGFDNVAGDPTGNITAYSMLATAGIAKQASPSLSLGITGTVIREKLDTESANTMAVSAGALYRLPVRPFSTDYQVGLSILNVGPGLKFISERDPLPMQARAGIGAMNIKELPMNATFDVVLPNDNDLYAATGFEYWLKNMLALRAGYTLLNAEGSGLRLGMGLKMGNFLFDYAYAGVGDLGMTHRVTASFKWGVKTIQISQAERSLMKEARIQTENGDLANAIMTYNEILDRNPENERAFVSMLAAHERMLKKDLDDAVTEIAAESTGTPADALGNVAVNTNISGDVATMNNDPLGLENLPSAENLEGAVAAAATDSDAALTFRSPAQTQAPAASYTQPSEPQVMTPAADAPQEPSGPALNMNDIYNNPN